MSSNTRTGSLDDAQESWRSGLDLAVFDVVWNRRRMPFALPERLHSDDREFCRRESRAFADGLWDFVSPSAFWVNPLTAAARAKRKLTQLVTARDCGFTVPDTLMSNDPREIRAFANEHGGAVYKTFIPAFWEEGHRFRSLFATIVHARDLTHDDALQLCPGIYQAPIRADYELRVTVFGRNVFALQHRRAPNARGIDARAGHLDGMETAPYTLPETLREQLFSFMNSMGLRFACFDILAMGGGDYCFLEANEAGQFLWVEQLQPQIPMLDAFCSYLESADDDHSYAPRANSTRLGDCLESDGYVEVFERQHGSEPLAQAPLFVAV